MNCPSDTPDGWDDEGHSLTLETNYLPSRNMTMRFGNFPWPFTASYAGKTIIEHGANMLGKYYS